MSVDCDVGNEFGSNEVILRARNGVGGHLGELRHREQQLKLIGPRRQRLHLHDTAFESHNLRARFRARIAPVEHRLRQRGVEFGQQANL